jgi:hypothetical protein
MKDLFFFLLLAVNFLTAASCAAQTGANNHFKYWVYHQRLEQEFVRVGFAPQPPAGQSYPQGYNYGIPTPSAQVLDDLPGEMLLRFGDGLAETGWYLCALATEYGLLVQQGLPTDSTFAASHWHWKPLIGWT